jgi:hypothetical protein
MNPAAALPAFSTLYLSPETWKAGEVFPSVCRWCASPLRIFREAEPGVVLPFYCPSCDTPGRQVAA